jgi:hypothetical protein
MSWAGWLNTAWMLKCAGEARAFRRAIRHVAHAQAEVLVDILRRNRQTTFGRAHGFRHLSTPKAYQDRVPLSGPGDYAEPVQRIAAGEAGVLTAERVELLEPTSGTTGGEKLIPYTPSLRRQVQRALAVWIDDLFRHRPALRRGRAYWSLSPALGPARRTAAGISIGFDDDASYLGGLERLALKYLLVVPAEVARLGDLAAVRYATLLHLLAAGDLTLISVWNPTFLTALLRPLEEWQDRLRQDLRRGTLHLGTALRAPVVEGILRSSASWPEKLQQIWPQLGLISCWMHAAAARAVPEVRALFPTVEIQPKGLLATEGCVSIPLLGRPAPALAVRSHFFEFQEGEGGPCRLAHELQTGGRYRVILTTGGGLYRYQLRDEVEVVDFEWQCPLLRFLGKADRISDLVGEKLAEPHVRAVLERLFAAQGLCPGFALLAPVEGRPARYRLFIQDAPLPSLTALATGLEAGLRENPYYGHAVALGQLAPAEVAVLDPSGEPAWQVYERCCVARGQRAGNIKPAALDGWTGWAQEFRPIRRPV